MVEYQEFNILGAVEIKPVVSLPAMAAVVGQVLGVCFVEDPAGRNEEFPSFSAESAGLEFCLLGIPDAADQVGDEPIETFTLQISMSFRTDRARDTCDCSSYFAELLAQRAGLETEPRD